MRGDGGFVAGLEALAFGVLVFVVGTLLLLNAWAVVDAHFATNAAAREAVRAVIEAPPSPAIASGGTSEPVPLEALAVSAARQAVAAHGYGGSSLRLTLHTPDGLLRRHRCAPIRIEAALDVRLVVLPGIIATGPRTVASSYEEIVDPLRAGLDARDGLDLLPDEDNPCGF